MMLGGHWERAVKKGSLLKKSRGLASLITHLLLLNKVKKNSLERFRHDYSMKLKDDERKKDVAFWLVDPL